MAKLNITEELKKFKLIDAHMHLGVAANTLYYKSDNDRVIEVQKKFNVEVSVCSPIIGIFGDLDAQMEVVTEGQKKYGKSVYWQLVYYAKLPQKSLDVIEKYRKKINFAGVKIYSVGSDLPLDSSLYYPLWEYAVANEVIVAAHTWSPYTENPKQFYGNPLLFAGPLRDFPKLKIILVHSGGKANFYDEVIDFIRKYEHVYMDFSGDCFYPPVFKKVINKAGKTKSLFGTDMPMMDVRYHIANVLVADVTDSDKADIFYNNSARLFKFS